MYGSLFQMSWFRAFDIVEYNLIMYSYSIYWYVLQYMYLEKKFNDSIDKIHRKRAKLLYKVR